MRTHTAGCSLPRRAGCWSGNGSTSAEVMRRLRLDAKLDACCATSEGAAGHDGRWGAMRASNLDRIARLQ